MCGVKREAMRDSAVWCTCALARRARGSRSLHPSRRWRGSASSWSAEGKARAAPRKLHGPVYDDLLKLKYLHQRYTNYRRWLDLAR